MQIEDKKIWQMTNLALQVIACKKGIVDYHFCKLIGPSPSIVRDYAMGRFKKGEMAGVMVPVI